MTCPREKELSKAERRRMNIGTRQDVDKKVRMGARLRQEDGAEKRSLREKKGKGRLQDWAGD